MGKGRDGLCGNTSWNGGSSAHPRQHLPECRVTGHCVQVYTNRHKLCASSSASSRMPSHGALRPGTHQPPQALCSSASFRMPSHGALRPGTHQPPQTLRSSASFRMPSHGGLRPGTHQSPPALRSSGLVVSLSFLGDMTLELDAVVCLPVIQP